MAEIPVAFAGFVLFFCAKRSKADNINDAIRIREKRFFTFINKFYLSNL
jgi:hypothetical protein